MKIDGWHIDGYGVHHDLPVTDLATGLTIISGPNESGKTTLQHFLVGMLFGFTATNRPDHHAPLRGGTYGGRLFITDDDGRPLTIHRGARRSSLRVTDDHGPVDPQELQQVLGGATRDLYQAIFAVHTDELEELKALTDDQVRDRVFSAGILGAGRTAQNALDQLTEERDQLLKPGGRSPDRYAIKRLRGELVQARGDLAEARREAKGLSALVSRIRSLEQDRERQRDARNHLQADRSLLAAVAGLWPSWADAADARAQLDRMGTIPSIPADARTRLVQVSERRADRSATLESTAEALAAATTELQGLVPPGPTLVHQDAIGQLAARAPAERERQATIADLQARTDHLDHELAEALDQLGPGRDETWVAGLPATADAGTALRAAAGAVEAAQRQLHGTEEIHRRTRAELDDALAEQAALERQLAERPHHPTGRSRQAADDATALVTLITQRDGLAHRRGAPQTGPAADPSRLAARTGPALLIIAAIVAATGVAGIISGATAPGALTLAISLALAVLSIALIKAAAADRSAEGATTPNGLSDLDEAIAPLLGSLGLAQRPTLAEAISLRAGAERLAAEALEVDQQLTLAARQRAVLDERSTRFEIRRSEEIAEARAQLDRARQAWSSWLTDNHLDARLDPTGAAEILDTLARVRTLRRSVAESRAGLEKARAQHQQWCTEVRELVGDHHLPISTDPDQDPLAAIDELAAAVRRDEAAQRRLDEATGALDSAQRHHDESQRRFDAIEREVADLLDTLGAETIDEAQAVVDKVALADDLATRIHAAERDLGAAVGTVPEQVAKAQDLLAQADPTRWNDELAALDRDLRSADETIDDTTTELAHHQRQLDDLQHSADVPTAELAVHDLEAQITEAVQRWASLTVAHQLVEATLARYQRERQPDVVKRAAQLFDGITEHRYPRLEVRDRAVIAIDATGREVPAGDLSTGTTEQLYLSLRFALAESYARTARLPLLLDDITVNADGGRHHRLAETIADIAGDTQVFVFTCHDDTVDLLQGAAPDARVLTLATSAPATPKHGRLGLAAG